MPTTTEKTDTARITNTIAAQSGQTFTKLKAKTSFSDHKAGNADV